MISLPFNLREPESGVTIPQSALKRVVFPAPLGPISPRTSPFLNSKLTPFRALRPPKFTERSLTESATPSVMRPPLALIDSLYSSCYSRNYLIIDRCASASPRIGGVRTRRSITI